MTTASPVQEEGKPQDVVSELKNAPKDNRKNSQTGKSKKRDNPWRSPGERQGSSAHEDRQGERQSQAQKQTERQRARHSREQQPDVEFWQGKEEHIQGSRLWKRKERWKKWRQDRRKIERSNTCDDSVIHLFSNLMEGATMQDWLSLFDFQNTRRHVHYYNHVTRCIDQPCQSAARWPVLWNLARFHPRRVWCGKSLPNLHNFKASLNIFANRVRWRWFVRDTPRQQFSTCVPSHGKTKVCTHPVALSLDTWISKFKRCHTEVFAKSSRTASLDRSFCNKIPLVNFGLEILSKSGHEAVANDKDGGYSLVDPEVLKGIHLHLLGNGQYFETDFTNWD